MKKIIRADAFLADPRRNATVRIMAIIDDRESLLESLEAFPRFVVHEHRQT